MNKGFGNTVVCTNWVHAEYYNESFRQYFRLVDESGEVIMKIPCARRVTMKIGDADLVYSGGKFTLHKRKEKAHGGWMDVAIPIHDGSEFAITYRERDMNVPAEFLDLKLIRRE